MDCFKDTELFRSNHKFSVFHLNIQGCLHKIDELSDTFQVLKFHPTIVCFTEHWLSKSCKNYLDTFAGYEVAAFYGREHASRGGSCIMVKQGVQYSLESRLCDLSVPFSFECCAVTIKLAFSDRIVVAAVYRSPSSSIDSFIDAFESLVDGHARGFNSLIVCGDFNVDFLRDSRERKLFLDVVNSANGNLNITCPTRIDGRGSRTCIDNIITFFKEFQSQSHVFETGLSDHLAQLTVLSPLSPRQSSTVEMKFRMINNENIHTLNSCLQHESWVDVIEAPDCNTAFKSFLNTFLRLFNHACPERSKKT
ncbi:MAG: endonuclease/exonuclease/phosphatase family protein [Candidatus Sulcia muelleri]|nr:endonuclease/exonuclease/phosphatase family protein [Candidatus Karelsulcia muelleri]